MESTSKGHGRLAYRFKVNSQTGSIINAMDDPAFVYLFRPAGLVE